MKPITIKFTINGNLVRLDTMPNRTLLQLLREDLNLTGTKDGCSAGECGACTVIVDGQALNSCLILAGQVDGRIIETIEGLAREGQLHPLQKAFLEQGAVQCGFCIPGMLMSAKALLDVTPLPTENQIREALAGNFCRCTGYKKIITAIQQAAEELSHV